MRKQKLTDQLSAYAELSCANTRLLKFMADYFVDAKAIIDHGDPLSYLLQELSSHSNSDLMNNAKELLDLTISWCNEQFVHLGKTAEAAKILAMHFVANIKSISLLALTQKDPNIITEQLELLGNWLDNL